MGGINYSKGGRECMTDMTLVETIQDARMGRLFIETL